MTPLRKPTSGGMASKRSGFTQGEQHLSALTEEEHRKLVDSALRFKRSVVKLVGRETEEDKHEGIGTAFLVHRTEELRFFLSCHHVIAGRDPEAFVVRFMQEGEVEALECKIKVISQDDDRDLLLFSTKEGPENLEPLEFSMEPIKRSDKVAAIGYSFMIVPGICDTMLVINEPSIMTGRMLVDSFEMEVRKPRYTYRAAKAISDTRCTAGNSGSPIIRDNKVIALHGQADATWRESIPANIVLNFLASHLKKRAVNVTIGQLLRDIAARETTSLISKSKREDEGKDAPKTSRLNMEEERKEAPQTSKLNRENEGKEAPQTSELNREGDVDKTPETSNPRRWKDKTYERKKRKPKT